MAGRCIDGQSLFMTNRQVNTNLCLEFCVRNTTELFNKWNILMYMVLFVFFIWKLAVQFDATYLFVLLCFCGHLFGKLLYTIHSECLLVVAPLGLQLTSIFTSGFQRSMFIPWSSVTDVIINEAMSQHKVVYYLAVSVHDNHSVNQKKKIIPLFQVTIMGSRSSSTSDNQITGNSDVENNLIRRCVENHCLHELSPEQLNISSGEIRKQRLYKMRANSNYFCLPPSRHLKLSVKKRTLRHPTITKRLLQLKEKRSLVASKRHQNCSKAQLDHLSFRLSCTLKSHLQQQMGNSWSVTTGPSTNTLQEEVSIKMLHVETSSEMLLAETPSDDMLQAEISPDALLGETSAYALQVDTSADGLQEGAIEETSGCNLSMVVNGELLQVMLEKPSRKCKSVLIKTKDAQFKVTATEPSNCLFHVSYLKTSQAVLEFIETDAVGFEATCLTNHERYPDLLRLDVKTQVPWLKIIELKDCLEEFGEDERHSLNNVGVHVPNLIQDLAAIPLVILERMSEKTLRKYYLIDC